MKAYNEDLKDLQADLGDFLEKKTRFCLFFVEVRKLWSEGWKASLGVFFVCGFGGAFWCLTFTTSIFFLSTVYIVWSFTEIVSSCWKKRWHCGPDYLKRTRSHS